MADLEPSDLETQLTMNQRSGAVLCNPISTHRQNR